jgi:Rrf2 family transcriptional regulator, cysteine metabolism repressor
MRMSVKVQYGLQALVELAYRYGVEPVQIADIAKRQGIPVRYLEQLMLVLKKRGMVSSSRGKKGGYVLAKNPDHIKIIDVVDAFDGPIEFVNKKMKKNPEIAEVFISIQNDIKASFSKTTLDDLVYKKRKLDKSYTYNI